MNISIKKVLMERDGLSEVEAEDQIAEAKQQLNEYIAEGDLDSAYDICQDEFGLEPDYLEDLIF